MVIGSMEKISFKINRAPQILKSNGTLKNTSNIELALRFTQLGPYSKE